MKLNSLAFRLLLIAIAWTLIVLPLAGFLIDRRHKANVYRTFDRQLMNELLYVIVHGGDAVRFGRDWYGVAAPLRLPDEQLRLYEDPASGWSWMIKAFEGVEDAPYLSPSLAGRPFRLPSERGINPTVMEPDEPATAASESAAKTESGAARSEAPFIRLMDDKSASGETVRVIDSIQNVAQDQTDQWYSFAVSAPLASVEREITNFRTELVRTLLFAGAALMVLAALSARFLLHPLLMIEKGLSEIRSGATQRLEGRLPAEIEPLRQEVNALIVSNAEIIERARRQVGNLAHALKTPLAVIVNEARDKTNPLAVKVAEQAEIMRDQVNRYLDRARIAAQAGMVGRVTEVGPVADAIIRALARIHDEKSLEITQAGTADARFQGEKQDLEELLGNLLDNGCKWAKSRVELSASPLPPDERGRKRMLIAVDDDGPGLTPEQRAQGIKRGRRLDESKPGSGLGLTIVSDLIDSYQGRLRLEASHLGGLRVEVELPAV